MSPALTPTERTSPRPRALSRWGIPLTLATLLACSPQSAAQPRGETVAPDDAPASLRIVTDDEPGEPLVVSGRVTGADGEPLAGASVFAYQTGADGVYGPNGNSDPRLRAYLRTDADGRYRFETVRPGSYPGTRIAAHIHFHVTPRGGEEAVSEVVFEGDTFITDRMRSNPFFVVLPVEEGEDGAQRVRYDIALGG